MKQYFKKIIVSLDLYNLFTLLAKFHEIYVINPLRFFYFRTSSVPEHIADSSEYTLPLPATNFITSGVTRKTIYFLIHCFYPFSQGGTERFVYNMARQAKNDGHRVKIITYNALESRRHFKNAVAGILFDEYQIDGLDVIEYRHRKAPRGILHDMITDDPDVADFAQFLFDRERPDIVHAAYIQKVASFLAACRTQGIPYGITFTSFFCLCHYDILIDQKGALCGGSRQGYQCSQVCQCLEIPDPVARHHKMQQLLQDAAFLTAPSFFVKKVISQEFANIEIEVINHGISREFSDGTQAPTANHAEIKNFAFFGNLTPIKGVHVLIAAFKVMPSDCTLHIYGSGPESYLRRLRKLINGQKNIILHGRVQYNEMKQAYAANQVIVVPSIWYETYNFVIHEALLMNKLVIAARIGAMPEIIRNGVNGLTFSPGDQLDLQRCLQRVLDPNFAPGLSKSCTINTIEQESGCYYNIYESVLQEAT
ncbi:MAG: glycosyltransferase [Syntrophomonadaceae bacterium]